MKKIKLAISGLGRLGAMQAENLAYRIPGCKLIAACDPDTAKLQWAKEHLGVDHTYTNFTTLCKQEDIDGIFIVSPTALHGEHIIGALQSGKHVFCEKPLAMTIRECVQIEQEGEKFKKCIAMIGFSRRYDAAYMRAKAKVDAGQIGRPFFIRSTSSDMHATAAFQIEFSKKSGGIFVDMAIHDVDMVHWMSGQQLKRVFGVGGAYCNPSFAEFNDADNAAVLGEQQDGTMAMIQVTRDSFYGDSTDLTIQGTKGALHVNNHSRRDQLDEYIDGAMKIECTDGFSQRFRQAFITEAECFVDHIRSNTQPQNTLTEATYATKAAIACRQALQTKSIIELDEVTD